MPPMRKCIPIRETITYPIVKVTPETDSCHNKSLPCEHVLDCGHLITTPKPDEPCAPNCYHVSTSKHTQKLTKVGLGTALSLDFYCDACVEVAIEPQIEATLSCKAADSKRASLRREEAAKRDKANKYRKCYIAQKVTSVPCDEDGDEVDDYDHCTNGHPFDTALPRTGANIFEDIEVLPPERKKPKRKDPFGKSGPLTITLDASDSDSDSGQEDEAGDSLAEDFEDTLVEGARWLQEQEGLQHRRQEEGAPSTWRRRAAARPVISSSPDTSMSSFIVDSSGPLTAHTSPKSNIQPPGKKKRDKKRKRSNKDTVVTVPELQALRRPRTAPQAPSSLRVTKLTEGSPATVAPTRLEQRRTGGRSIVPPVSKARNRHAERASSVH